MSIMFPLAFQGWIVNRVLLVHRWLKDRLSLKGGFSRFQQQPCFEGIFKIFHSLPPFLDIQEQQNLQIFCRILFIRQKATYKQNFVARKKPSKVVSQQAKKVNGRFYIPKGVALQFLLPYFIIIIHRTCFNFKLLCFSGLQQDLSWGPTWVLSHGQGFGKAAEIQHYWYKR